jgi:hypothetical protein
LADLPAYVYVAAAEELDPPLGVLPGQSPFAGLAWRLAFMGALDSRYWPCADAGHHHATRAEADACMARVMVKHWTKDDEPPL